jgi:hypothetical protein
MIMFVNCRRLAPWLSLVAAFSLAGLPGQASAEVRSRPASVAASKKPVVSAHPGDVYLVRGLGGMTSGLNILGTEMKNSGIDAKVVGQSSWQSVVSDILANRKKYGRKPVILIGHSLGANAIIRIAQELKASGVTVDYMVSFAAASPKPVPSNVRKVTNYYFSTGSLGKILVAAGDFHGELINLDYARKPGIGHFNIEEQADIHREIIRNVRRYVRPMSVATSG